MEIWYRQLIAPVVAFARDGSAGLVLGALGAGLVGIDLAASGERSRSHWRLQDAGRLQSPRGFEDAVGFGRRGRSLARRALVAACHGAPSRLRRRGGGRGGVT